MRNKILIITIMVIVVISIIVIRIYIKSEIEESKALILANQAVSEYGIAFDSIEKESAELAQFVSNFIDECDFLDYNYDEVWVAQKDLGEKEINGDMQDVIVYVYVGFDGRVCREAKLIDVIPGIITIESVFPSEVCGNEICEELENFMSCPSDCEEKTEYITISELNDFCQIPSSCGQETACEGKEIKIKGYIDYNNIFDKENYPQLSYEKFKIEDKETENSIEIFAIAEDNTLIFEKIRQNNEKPLRMIFVTGIIEGFDMQIMTNCGRGIKLNIDSEADIYFE